MVKRGQTVTKKSNVKNKKTKKGKGNQKQGKKKKNGATATIMGPTIQRGGVKLFTTSHKRKVNDHKGVHCEGTYHIERRKNK